MISFIYLFIYLFIFIFFRHKVNEPIASKVRKTISKVGKVFKINMQVDAADLLDDVKQKLSIRVAREAGDLVRSLYVIKRGNPKSELFLLFFSKA